MSNKLYRNLECGMYGRLEKLALSSNFTLSQVTNEYIRRKEVIQKAYGPQYKGRESHILALAYRGTEKYMGGGDKN